eukprot:GILI01008771.1.p2 GENE.GILI01008771.1~~GILI01008771.1.p2  ORF type:complete len:118 (+),score=9.46 GILI01008771.1:40-354(+)
MDPQKVWCEVVEDVLFYEYDHSQDNFGDWEYKAHFLWMPSQPTWRKFDICWLESRHYPHLHEYRMLFFVIEDNIFVFPPEDYTPAEALGHARRFLEESKQGKKA